MLTKLTEKTPRICLTLSINTDILVLWRKTRKNQINNKRVQNYEL